MEIAINDNLRSEVETASGGKQTVLYTFGGQPTYMNVIPAFKCEELGAGYVTGLHPAFIVGGVEKSEIFIGTYQAVIRNGEALSLPGEDPATGINFDQARAACFASGPGFHLMTNWEWEALALWCTTNGYGQLRGNTMSGKSHANVSEAGTISKYGRTLTGSGPASWRHDGTKYGIADLVGNVWEWNDGLKLVEGRILMPADNDFSMAEENWPDTGSCIDFHEEEGMQISDAVTDQDWDGGAFTDVVAKAGYEIPLALKQALISPIAGQNLTGHSWADNSEDFEELPIRGGCWSSESVAGLAALDLICERSISHSDLGFRPAFIV